MTTYRLKYLTTCNSSYFNGSSEPTVQCLVDGTTPVQDVKTYLLDTDELPEEIDYTLYKREVESWFSSYTEAELLEPWEKALDIPQTDEEWEFWDCYSYFNVLVIEGEDSGE